MRATRIILGMTTVVIAAVAVFSPVSAVTYGGGSVQGYEADTELDNGRIVQLAGGGSSRVKVATQSDLKSMFGVTVNRNQLSLTLSKEGMKHETFVAVSGTYNVLVSTQGGPIAAGDYVTLSSVDGVAMKADTEVKTVFGRATDPFDGEGISLGTTTLKDAEGKTNKTVKLGSVPVTIDIRDNPTVKSTKANVPEILERAGQAIAEKPVSPIRIYLSIAIAVVCVIAVLLILYAGVRNGVVSIGRNPMSKKSIFRALIEIILTSVVILIIGVFAVYLLLKL